MIFRLQCQRAWSLTSVVVSMAINPKDWNGLQLAEDRYQVTSKLGEGGMAYVYCAHDHHLNADVVIKVPRLAMLDEPKFITRFKQEIQSLVRLSHPHIVRVHDVGVHGGIPFAVLQYLGGGSLDDHREVGPHGEYRPATIESIGGWLMQIAQALDFVHAQGYVHRDVKPGNILFDTVGNAYLGDFGVAKVIAETVEAGSRQGLTATGMVLGTAGYSPLEVSMGKPFDGRADQYALAVTLFEVLTGKRLFEGDTLAAVLIEQANSEPLEICSLSAELPNGLAEVISRALAQEPDQRFASCLEFAQAVLVGNPAIPVPGSPPPAQNDAISADVQVPSQPAQTKIEPLDPADSPQASLATSGQQVCPACGTALYLSADVAAKTVRCPKCQVKLYVAEDLSQVTTGPASGPATMVTDIPADLVAERRPQADDSARSQRWRDIPAAPVSPPSQPAGIAWWMLLVTGLLAALHLLRLIYFLPGDSVFESAEPLLPGSYFCWTLLALIPWLASAYGLLRAATASDSLKWLVLGICWLESVSWTGVMMVRSGSSDRWSALPWVAICFLLGLVVSRLMHAQSERSGDQSVASIGWSAWRREAGLPRWIWGSLLLMVISYLAVFWLDAERIYQSGFRRGDLWLVFPGLITWTWLLAVLAIVAATYAGKNVKWVALFVCWIHGSCYFTGADFYSINLWHGMLYVLLGCVTAGSIGLIQQLREAPQWLGPPVLNLFLQRNEWSYCRFLQVIATVLVSSAFWQLPKSWDDDKPLFSWVVMLLAAIALQIVWYRSHSESGQSSPSS